MFIELIKCLDNTEIAVHDGGNRLASLMYYEGGTINKITIGRDMGWSTISSVNINGTVTCPNITLGSNGKINSSDDYHYIQISQPTDTQTQSDTVPKTESDTGTDTYSDSDT